MNTCYFSTRFIFTPSFYNYALWVLLCVGSIGQSYGQKKLKSTDTAQVNQMIRVANAYSTENPDMALHYGIKAQEQARLIDYEEGVTASWRILGKICSYMEQYELALDYEKQALEYYQQHQDEKKQAEILGDISTIFAKMKEYEQALNFKIRALKIEDQLGDFEAIARSNNKIGALYADLGNYELGLDYCMRALQLREKMKNTKALIDSYTVIGLVYTKSKAYTDALYYLQKASDLQKDFPQKEQEGEILAHIGDVYTKQGKFKEATIYYNNALQAEEKQGERKKIIYSLMLLGKNGIELQQYPQAISYLEKALEIAKNINAKEQIEYAYAHLSEAYERSGNHQEALKLYKVFADYQKKIYDESAHRKILEMHDLIEAERKDKEIMVQSRDGKIRSLEAEKLRSGIYILMSFIGFLIVICVLVIMFARSKNKPTVII
jgi:tetratricopeptide (TPR) repeat protein